MPGTCNNPTHSSSVRNPISASRTADIGITTLPTQKHLCAAVRNPISASRAADIGIPTCRQKLVVVSCTASNQRYQLSSTPPRFFQCLGLATPHARMALNNCSHTGRGKSAGAQCSWQPYSFANAFLNLSGNSKPKSAADQLGRNRCPSQTRARARDNVEEALCS